MSVSIMQADGIRFPPDDAMFPGELIPGTPEFGAPCVGCGDPLTAGVVIVWASVAGDLGWHTRCAQGWLLAFTRDVWEAQRVAGVRADRP